MAITAKNTQGFTLIEIIVTLLLVGIITVFAGMGIVRVIQGFLFTKENATTVQKGQMVMARLIKEFTVIKSITSGNATSMVFSSHKWLAGQPTLDEVSVSIYFSSGNLELTLGDDKDLTLTDQVSDFALKYYDAYDATGQDTPSSSTRIIQITLTLEGADGFNSKFIDRVTPRNLKGG